MRRISSTWTWYFKIGGPLIALVALGAVFVGIAFAVREGLSPFGDLFLPVVLAIILTVGWCSMLCPQMDKVSIEDGDMVVRNRGLEDRFPVSNILRIGNSRFRRPESVLLTLKRPCRFGSKVEFIPKGRWLPLGPHPIVEELKRLSQGVRQLDDDGSREGEGAR